ncbi:cAMP receptor protein [Pelotomaculum schinkii]|uniref:cAMP receptor protein n=1 Tax=Pelotomaculum schinkii TaxID=78350 RepID=A0A4Y7RHR2_9FIRM|nr:Crp/Fnr family transcriptional regulator [Pelotomaculum schinkii]TEB08524.1 cAMP receptor protein [Pelotomaculum schinkii]
MFKKWMKVLAKCALFEGISPEELNIVLSCLNPKVSDYDKNETLTVTGERLSGLGIVLAGEVVVAKENAAGNRVIMAVNGPGEMFGEIAAFSEDGVWPASVVARGACTVMLLPAGKIVGSCERSCGSHKLLITNMLGIVSDKALMLNRKVEYLAIRSLRGKISTFLLEQYRRTGKDTFMMPLKRNELADFLNVSRPSLSREMSRMRDEGVIDFHRDSIKIKQVEALRSMAG